MMTEELRLIADTVDRILRDQCTSDFVDSAEQGTPDPGLWQSLHDNGLVHAGINEAVGGSGAGRAAALLVLRACGRYCAPLPMADTFVAASLLAETGETLPGGALTVAPQGFTLDGNQLRGECSDVAFAGACDTVVIIAQAHDGPVLVPVAASSLKISGQRNLAGEPSGTVAADCAVDKVLPAAADVTERCQLLGATTRAVMMAGAMESILSLSVDYAQTRVQFGRPLSKFQAIQQQLAQLAGETAACMRAADALIFADSLTVADVAVAKSRIGEACALVAEVSHQVHGAIGYTLEHQLNHATRRLWLWRDQYGQERYWNEVLGELAMADGGDGVWPFITAA